MTESRPGVLIVDDESKAVKYLQAFLASGCSVFTARSAPEAIDIMERNARDIDIVITDHRMPQKTGMDLLVELKDRFPQVSRVLTSAYLTDEAVSSARENRVIDEFLVKPWNLEHLSTVINRLTDRGRSVSEAAVSMAPDALGDFLQAGMTPLLFLLDHLQSHPSPDIVEPEFVEDVQAHLSELTRTLGWVSRLWRADQARSPHRIEFRTALSSVLGRTVLLSEQHLLQVETSCGSETIFSEDWELEAFLRFVLIDLCLAWPAGAQFRVESTSSDAGETIVSFHARPIGSSSHPARPFSGAFFDICARRVLSRIGAIRRDLTPSGSIVGCQVCFALG